MHGVAEILARDVDVAAVFERRVGHDESEAGRVRLQPADVKIQLLRQAEPVAADLDDVAGIDEGFELALEGRRARRAAH